MRKTPEDTTMSLLAESLPLLWQQEAAMSVASTSAVVLSKERQAIKPVFQEIATQEVPAARRKK